MVGENGVDGRYVYDNTWKEYVDLACVVEGRPDFNDKSFGVTLVKKFPPYVFSTRANAALVHRVSCVKAHWYLPDGRQLVRRKRPRLIAETVCGTWFVLKGDRSRTCQIPAKDAILCGRCHGEPATFGPHGEGTKRGIRRVEAYVKLGCVVEGE